MVSPSHATPTMPAMPPEGARLAADLIDVDLAVGASFRDHIPHEAFDEIRRHGGIAWHAEPPVAGTMGGNPMLQFVDSPGCWVAPAHELAAPEARAQEPLP